MGQSFIETWGWLGSERDKRRRYVRRIHLLRPGAEDVVLITDLLDADRYPAQDLLDLANAGGLKARFNRLPRCLAWKA